MAGLLEGVSAITMACTLVISIPTLAIVLAARDRAPLVVASSVAATGTVMWARAAGIWNWRSDGWMVVPIALAIGVAFVLAWRSGRLPQGGAAAVGAVAGAVAGWLWRPCVGEHLASILNDAEVGSPISLLSMIAYTTGALLPVVIVAALPRAWPALQPAFANHRVAAAGAATGAVYAAAVASGRYNDLVGELFRISST